mmetsp:Transcript_79581/g.138096  ORF Transcript_79581/g.138096 Transcript_79581/m.138096 type:complete len:80 (+) Transcript_79581:1-240(+)
MVFQLLIYEERQKLAPPEINRFFNAAACVLRPHQSANLQTKQCRTRQAVDAAFEESMLVAMCTQDNLFEQFCRDQRLTH